MGGLAGCGWCGVYWAWLMCSGALLERAPISSYRATGRQWDMFRLRVFNLDWCKSELVSSTAGVIRCRGWILHVVQFVGVWIGLCIRFWWTVMACCRLTNLVLFGSGWPIRAFKWPMQTNIYIKHSFFWIKTKIYDHMLLYYKNSKNLQYIIYIPRSNRLSNLVQSLMQISQVTFL